MCVCVSIGFFGYFVIVATLFGAWIQYNGKRSFTHEKKAQSSNNGRGKESERERDAWKKSIKLFDFRIQRNICVFFILCRIVKVPVMFRCSARTKPWMDMGIFIKYIDVTMPVCSKTIHQSTKCPSLSLRFDSVCGYRSYETLKILFVG